MPARTKNVDLHIIPGVLHGYRMGGNATAYHAGSYRFSMARALAVLDGLRGEARRKARSIA